MIMSVMDTRLGTSAWSETWSSCFTCIPTLPLGPLWTSFCSQGFFFVIMGVRLLSVWASFMKYLGGDDSSGWRTMVHGWRFFSTCFHFCIFGGFSCERLFNAFIEYSVLNSSNTCCETLQILLWIFRVLLITIWISFDCLQTSILSFAPWAHNLDSFTDLSGWVGQNRDLIVIVGIVDIKVKSAAGAVILWPPSPWVQTFVQICCSHHWRMLLHHTTSRHKFW